jgi:hypothetical protein
VAISSDEGASWRLVPVASSPVQDLYITSMAADRAGNLYLAWIAGTGATTPSQSGGPDPATEGLLGSGRPLLSISRDHGATWSKPAAVAPRGVAHAHHVAVTATGRGKVAVSYLAGRGDGTLLSGYLSATGHALARRPRWWAAPLNDPATPLVSTADSETFGDRLFFMTDTFAPSGRAWAAFHCAKTSACPGERVGVVGRLSAPRRAAR